MDRRQGRGPDAAEERVRAAVAALVAAAGGQRAFARATGLSQAGISRFLTGGHLTPTLFRGLHAAYPDLRELATAVYIAGRKRDPKEASTEAA